MKHRGEEQNTSAIEETRTNIPLQNNNNMIVTLTWWSKTVPYVCPARLGNPALHSISVNKRPQQAQSIHTVGKRQIHSQ